MPADERRFSIRALLVVAALSILGTVLALEFSGRIVHSDDKARVPVGEFEAIYVGPREDYRMSPKPSQLHAECHGGYLAVASDTDATLKGVLVDYRNRGIHCNPAPRPDTPAKETGTAAGNSDE
ncbi:kinase [Marinobacter bohaiensis]|uniref:kinase n=1 Tax=Marinobacter bohaiensis TaxID=2201898 RepID=UPI000DAC2E9C|nr:kinase [Marinobacter bohaiensis]